MRRTRVAPRNGQRSDPSSGSGLRLIRACPIGVRLHENQANAGKVQNYEGREHHTKDVQTHLLPAARHDLPCLEQQTGNTTTDGGRRPQSRPGYHPTEQRDSGGAAATSQHDSGKHHHSHAAADDQRCPGRIESGHGVRVAAGCRRPVPRRVMTKRGNAPPDAPQTRTAP
jgi:hypothetical protein